jgi:hypothetical protein
MQRAGSRASACLRCYDDSRTGYKKKAIAIPRVRFQDSSGMNRNTPSSFDRLQCGRFLTGSSTLTFSHHSLFFRETVFLSTGTQNLLVQGHFISGTYSMADTSATVHCSQCYIDSDANR